MPSGDPSVFEDGLWRVEHRANGDPCPDVTYKPQSTPALAICDAILELAKNGKL